MTISYLWKSWNSVEPLYSYKYPLIVCPCRFNWGLSVRKKSERILKLLEDGSFLKEEREKARKITSEMKGFGSFCQRSSTALVDGNSKDSTFGTYIRCNSHYNPLQNQEDDDFVPNKGYSIEERVENTQQSCDDTKSIVEKKEGTQDRYTKEEDHPFCDNKHHIRASLISFMG